MSAAAGNAAALRPDPDHALVVFLRPGRYGGAIQAAVYHEETIVVSSANTAIAYPTTPGSHRFMVVSEAADFLAADLRAGRVYYARVARRMGAWRARFSLPIDPRGQAHDLVTRLRRAQLVTMTEKTHRWDAENHASVLRKKMAFRRRWEEKAPRRASHAAPRGRRVDARDSVAPAEELALLVEGSYVTRQVTGNPQAARIGRRAAAALIERQLRRPPIPALRHRRRSP